MPVLTVQITGADQLSNRLAAAPAAIQSALAAKAADLAERLRRHVTDDKLSGQVLRSRSGVLRASIAAEVDDQAGQVIARVFSAGDVKYAAIQEYGGRTAPHDIVPDKAKALAFLVHGAPVFAHVVHHPGSQIPARSYLRSALADMGDQIIAEVSAAARDALPGNSP
jgi:phage gpG-like protein